ncbi:hypothetical protein RM553_14820 [Zunongwangia sp. F363]|uniref:Uncharacterized protein n=1 Tax=Autumnicola tepida TaxID=3075595 RepID=A0ABU3CCP5_9FLAO|nr:hypothetical protein [Zunongwangia sp. F363]MDT0644107.1 hypothetical protein [Zunongwangia sp. F363]
MNKTNAQDLSSHQWKNKFLLIFTENSDNAVYKNQIRETQKHKDA